MPAAQAIINGGPWGQHFPEPVFEGEFDVLEQRLLKEKHLKMRLQSEAQVFDAIAFNVDTTVWPDTATKRIGLVYQLDVNHYRGEDRLQLLARALWPLA